MTPRLLRAAALAAAALLSACGDDEPAAPPSAPPAAPAPPREVRVLGEVPRFELTDQSGERFGAGELAGLAWVANFVFTRCTATCPGQTREMAALAKHFAPDRITRQLRFVSFTVDPEHDTPEVLASYGRANGADPAYWKFLTGPREAIWKLSRDGFKLDVKDAPPGADMPILHSTKFVLVDTYGRIRGWYDGTSPADVGRLRTDVATVLREPHRAMTRPDISDPAWLETRGAAQEAAAKGWGVVHDFAFTDGLAASGIRFVGRATPDGGRDFRLVHYDHGTGVSVADVDGDGLLDLYLVNQVGGSQLWRNLGGGRFEDATEKAGVALRRSIAMSGTFADFDGDGDPDLFVTAIRSGNRLLENDGKGRFRDVTEKSGLGYRGHSSIGVPLDFDRDGRLDLFVANLGVFTEDAPAPASERPDEADILYHRGYHDAFASHIKPERTEPSILYRNAGGMRFENVTSETGLVDGGWTGDAAVLDSNDDGWPDLYVMNMQGRDELWENQGGRSFVRRGAEKFPKTPWGSMGFKVFDWDGDLDLDLLVTDMHSDMAEDVGPELEEVKSAGMLRQPESLLRSEGRCIYGNALYRNDGGGRFTEVSDEAGAENYWPWGPTVADLNADGDPDVYVPSGMGFMYRYGIDSVWLNDGGRRLLDAEFVLGVEPRPGRRTVKPWCTLELEGRDKAHPFAEWLSGTIEMWDALSSRGAAALDLDGDGDLDLVAQQFAWEPRVLVSDLAQRRTVRFLEVALVGSKSNRDGIGARVTVRAGGRSRLQVADGKSGYLAYSSMPLWFGLGEASSVESVEVLWPSGTRQVVTEGIVPNRRLVVREP